MVMCDKCGIVLTGGTDTYGLYGSSLCFRCYLPSVPEIGYPALIRTTQLIKSAAQGDVPSLEKLVKDGANVNAITPELDTALILACSEGHVKAAALLLAHNANPNLQNSNGSTALDEAINNNSEELVQLLLINGANPNLSGRISEVDNLPCLTALGRAVAKHNASIVSLLLKHNADSNARMTAGITGLYTAAAFGSVEVVKLLLRSGANIDAKANNNLRPLDIAIRNNHAEVVQLLKSDVSQQSFFEEQADNFQRKQVKVNGETVASYSIIPKKMNAAEVKNEAQGQTVERPVLQHLLSNLNDLTGLTQVKADVNQLVNFLRVQKLRKDKGLSVPQQSLHMVFTGNPGTGKTTIARLIAQIYRSMGILSQGQFVETDRAGLVGGYLGQTAIKTQEVVESALGGVLFIDEAYSLTDSTHGHDLYGQEAVATLLKMMEDHRDDLIVIVAGYTEPMQKFIRSNPGLQSRFNKFLHFDDYAPAELTEIFGYFAAQGDYNLHPATELKLHNVFADLYAKRDETFGNARLARNLFEKAINAHANRMVSAGTVDEASLVTLYPEDIPNG